MAGQALVPTGPALTLGGSKGPGGPTACFRPPQILQDSRHWQSRDTLLRAAAPSDAARLKREAGEGQAWPPSTQAQLRPSSIGCLCRNRMEPGVCSGTQWSNDRVVMGHGWGSPHPTAGLCSRAGRPHVHPTRQPPVTLHLSSSHWPLQLHNCLSSACPGAHRTFWSPWSSSFSCFVLGCT